ncbi:MAG: hypothetical protein E5X53_26160 [Mesorhizobium sp.]|uniref:hypothetical protein n=1 Tax=Mesorhizobium sp. TaxID=1871066 RepID=UPI00122A6F9D|nr:hypothetical protein [Mesorhizobium sp.]TIR49118.1 MAG: hypothetical protein E5X53_26160 [Mesorhizobium sp.]
MTDAEMVHFHSKRINVAQLCDKFGPIVKSYARTGTRKPRDVAVRLNAEGHRTVAGSRWTPHLTHILLGLIFLDPAKIRQSGVALGKDKVVSRPRPRSMFLNPKLAIYREGAKSESPTGPIVRNSGMANSEEARWFRDTLGE